jgi:PhnB protein
VPDFKPADYHTVTPYLVVDGAERLIAFIVDVLGGAEMMRLPGPDGRIGHAEMRIGDSVVMLADTPSPDGTTKSMLHVYVRDSDATYARALAAGATSLREPKTEFYGDRMSGVQDALGNQWYFATHVEDISEEEMARRAAAAAETASPAVAPDLHDAEAANAS